MFSFIFVKVGDKVPGIVLFCCHTSVPETDREGRLHSFSFELIIYPSFCFWIVPHFSCALLALAQIACCTHGGAQPWPVVVISSAR